MFYITLLSINRLHTNIVLVFPGISKIVVLDELLFGAIFLHIVDTNNFVLQIVVLDNFFATSRFRQVVRVRVFRVVEFKTFGSIKK